MLAGVQMPVKSRSAALFLPAAKLDQTRDLGKPSPEKNGILLEKKVRIGDFISFYSELYVLYSEIRSEF